MIAIDAPAKLTTTLRVVGVRPDGYHLIDAEMVALDLADRLELRPGTGIRVHGGPDVPVSADNLVVKALKLAGRDAHVTLHKRIPAGAGLGGGSADAAAILRWAGFTDLEAASTIGADVPFCLVGGRARVRGIGEVVDPQPPVPRTFTLLTPPIHVRTPQVYAKWDELGGPQADGANDLEPAALAVEPELARWRDHLGAETGRLPQLAGSGSTWFVAGAFPQVRPQGGTLRVVSTTIW